MQIERKKEVIDYLNGLVDSIKSASDLVPDLLQDQADSLKNKLLDLVTDISEKDLYVPVVGGFSAGKSTALNSLLERPVLPEKVTPETAIPAELHYGEQEKLVALSQSGGWSEHAVSDLPKLSESAHDYQVVRLYLNNPVLRKIEPLVLVDMPGFDSGFDGHNQAILRYLNTGALYFFLVDCKSGTIVRQDVRRIEEIIDNGRSVKVFLTKKDLASPQELDGATNYVSDQLSMIVGEPLSGSISKDDSVPLLSVLEEANIPSLFDAMTLPPVKDAYFDADGMINSAIKALKSDKEKVAKEQEKANLELKNVESERQQSLKDAENGGVTKKIDLVMSRLEKALRSASDDLTSQARMGERALSQTISELVRSTLTVEIQSMIRKSASDITYRFSGDIEIDSLSNNASWADNLISVIETEAMNALTGISSSMTEKSSEKSNNQGNAIGNVISSLSGLAIMIPNPVLKVVFAILPGIVGQFFGSVRENNESSKVKEAISSQVIPTVIAQVRPQVMSSLVDVESEMIRVVSEKISEKVRIKKAQYDDLAEKSEKEVEQLRGKLESLENIYEEMKLKANGVIG